MGYGAPSHSASSTGAPVPRLSGLVTNGSPSHSESESTDARGLSERGLVADDLKNEKRLQIDETQLPTAEK